ncbi:MAG: sensor histidine kinase, partial [Candidatus Sericytochromatia bacterium]
QATRALAGLVSGILDVCQLAAGTFQLHPRPIDLDEVIALATAEVRPQAEGKRQRLSVEIGELPVIEADDQRLHQVLTSLLGNAVKFTPEGGVIVLRARAEAGRVRLEVSDDGPGIAPEALPKLFEPFSQLDTATTRRTGGVGVGLAIAKALVEAHGGTIGVDSRVGCGSTFWLSLPTGSEGEA